MAGWQAKKFQLPNHNFETTAIKFEDGRIGLCYHGSTIWQHASGGWEDFIDSDWKKVWKEGTPCGFKDLPADMRIACPVCGAPIKPDDVECSQCGIIFDKMKAEPVVEEEPETEEPEETRRSKLVDLSLALVVLVIAGIFVYNAFLKPEPPPAPPVAQEQVGEQPAAAAYDQPAGQTDVYQARHRTEADTDSGYEEDAARNTEEEYVDPAEVEVEDYYRNINLDDPETAHHQLLEATNQLNQEAEAIRKALATASTPEEKRQVRIDKIRYDRKALQLSELIKEFNARNEENAQ